MPTATDILNVERSLIGVHETPPGSNIAHPITDWAATYGYSTGQAWCAWTQSYAFWHVPGGKELIHGVATGGSWVFRDNGIKYGEIIPGPLPGAIDVMKFAGDTSAPTSHVGMVESVNPYEGTWINIEGNHLDRCMRVPRHRQDDTQHWFIMPKYSSTPAPKPKTKETLMATVTSGTSTMSFSGIFMVGMMNEQPWDVWAKVQNPTPNPITVHFRCVTNTSVKDEDVSLGGNQIAQVQGKDLGASGNSLMVIQAPIACVMTFDHRPTT